MVFKNGDYWPARTRDWHRQSLETAGAPGMGRGIRKGRARRDGGRLTTAGKRFIGREAGKLEISNNGDPCLYS